MMVKILTIKKKGTKFQVFTDNDELGLIFTEDQIVENRIIKGSIFPEETWQKIKDSKNEGLLLDKALHYLNFKARTKKEMEDYLNNQTTDKEVINKIIKRLIELDFINDNRYTQRYILEGIRNGKGPILLTYQLTEKGIEINLIKEELINYPVDLQIEVAIKVANSYQKTITNNPKKKQKELITQKLIRSGFTYNIINNVLPKLIFNDDSLEQLQKEVDKLLAKESDKKSIIQKLMQKGYEYHDIKKVIMIDSSNDFE